MARPLRIEAPDAVYRVSVRGMANDVIARDDDDRRAFFQGLQHVVDRYSLLVHAYALLDDRYQLLVETPLANLSTAMQRLNGGFARHVNERHGRWGHLFGDRYRAAPIECGAELVNAARAIDLSPVVAGMCRRPAAYGWSSHAALIGAVAPPRFLVTHHVLRELDVDRPAARIAYRDYVAAGLREVHAATGAMPGVP